MTMQERVGYFVLSSGRASSTDDLLLLGADSGESQRGVINQAIAQPHFATLSKQTAAWKETPDIGSPGLGKGKCSLSWRLVVRGSEHPGCPPALPQAFQLS